MKSMMRWATLVAVVGLILWAAPAQARRDGDSEGAVKQPAAREGDAPNPEAKNRVRDREGSAQGEEALLGRQRIRLLQTGKVLTVAVTAPWATNDAQAQDLVDKALVSQKALLNAEAEQAELLAKLVKAARARDMEAVKAVTEQIKSSARTIEQNERALAEDMRVLNSRLGELNPNRERPPEKRVEGRPVREGAREGGDTPRKGAADAPREGG
jgi:hypothetical protein